MRKIPYQATVRILDSVAFLNAERGVTFNGMITVNFQQLGAKTEGDAKGILTAMNEAVSKKLARFWQRDDVRFPYYFVYVHEDVTTSYGHHVHQLVCMPRYIGEFLDAWLKDWAMRRYGVPPEDKAIDYRGRYLRGDSERIEQQSNLLRYVLKSSSNCVIYTKEGMPTTLHTILNAERYPRAYCADVAKVTGMSQNLANRAQLDMGFQVPQCLGSVFTNEHLQHWKYREHQREWDLMIRGLTL